VEEGLPLEQAESRGFEVFGEDVRGAHPVFLSLS
jgi:hypothetical protein